MRQLAKLMGVFLAGLMALSATAMAPADAANPVTKVSFVATPPGISGTSVRFSAEAEPSSSVVEGFECFLDGTTPGHAVACNPVPDSYPLRTDLSLQGLANGQHTFSIRALADESVPVGPFASYSWTVDQSANGAPTARIDDPKPVSPSYSSVTFRFSSPAADVVDYRCFIDSGPASEIDCSGTASGGHVTLSGLADGEHTFAVQAVDNENPAQVGPKESFTWSVHSAPDTTIVSNPPPIAGTSATFEFASPDSDVVDFECMLDGQIVTPGPLSPDGCVLTGPSAGKVQFDNGLPGGPHSFTVAAIDDETPAKKDPTPAGYDWVVNPDIGALPESRFDETPLNPSPATVTFRYSSRAGDVVDFECALEGPEGTVDVPCSGASPDGGSKTLSGLAAGDYTFRVKAVDDETPANIGPAVSYSWTVDPFTANGPPLAQFDRVPEDPSLPTIEFGYSSPAPDVVDYQCTLAGPTGPPVEVACSGSSPDGGTKLLENLEPGRHTFTIRAVDNENPAKIGPAVSHAWTVAAGPYTEFNRVPSDPSSTAVEFGYFSTDPGVVDFNCTLRGPSDPEVDIPCTGSSPDGGRKVLSDLEAGEYIFSVQAVDSATPANVGPAIKHTWTVDPSTPNGLPGVRLDRVPSDPSPRTVEFEYSSQAPDVIGYACKLQGPAGPAVDVPCPGSGPAGGRKTFSGLEAGRHTFSVGAVDQENFPFPGPYTSFTWTVDPDLDGPVSDGAPAVQLTATPANPSPSTVTFSYASSATDVVAYECFVDGTAAGDQVPCAGDSPAGGTKVLSGLSAGTHTFRVRAVDNENPPLTGAFAVFTWTVDPDLDGPVSDGAPAVQLTATPANPSPSTVTFSYASSATDVVAYECFVDGTAAGDQVPCAGDSPAGGTKVLSGLSAGTHTFRVRAVDNENPPLTGAFAVFTWTVDPDLDGPVSDGAPAVQLTATPANPSPSTVTFSYASSATDVVAYECFVDGTAAGDQVPCAGDSPAGGTKVLSGLSAGTHTFRVRAVDNENPPLTGAFAVFTWTVDPDLDGPVSDGAPAVQLTATPANPSPSTVTFSYASSATDVVAYECFVDGTAAGDQVPCAGDSPAGGTKVLSGLSAGTHTFRVRAVDNENPPLTGAFAVFTWTVDPDLDGPVSDGAPAVQLTATPANPSPSTVTFSYASPATDVVAYECFVDGTAAGDQVPCAGDSPAGGTKVLSGLSAGTHTFRVRAVDNENPPLTGAFAVFTWTVDPDLDGPVSDGAPAVQLTATPANPSPSTVTFSYASPATDVVAYECFVDGTAAGDQVPCAGDSPAGGTKVLSGLSAGTHTFRVRAVDNENPPLTGAFAVFTWTVDPDLDGPVSDGAPAVQLTATPANPSPSTVTFSYASPATDVVAYECFVDGTAAGDQVPCAGDSPAGGTKVLSGLSAGTHTFRVRAVDNENPPLTGAFAVFTWTVDPDLDGPVSDGAPAVQLTATPANPSPSTVTFSYASPATDVVAYECFVDGTAAGDQVPCAGDSPAGGTKVLSGLSAGTHTFRVRAVDNENPPLTGAFAVFTWTVDPDLDGPVSDGAPAVQLTATPANPSPSTVTFSYASPATDVVAYECFVDGTAAGDQVPCAGDSPAGGTKVLSGLSAGTHTFRVRAVDNENPPLTGAFAVFTWTVDPDLDGPVSDGAPAVQLTATPANPSPSTVTFSYASPATDVVAYECFVDGTAAGDQVPCAGDSPAGGTKVLSGLSAGTHTFRVRAVDNENPPLTGAFAVFTWTVDPDLDGPVSDGAPAVQLTATPANPSPSTVTFSYASPATDVVAYECFVDGTAAGDQVPCAGDSPAGGTKVLSGLSAGTHTFRVRAVDNENPPLTGAFAVFTWTVDPDLDGPVSDGAPAVQLTATPANPSPSTVTFSYASPATDVVAYECFVDGTAAGDQVPCAGDSPAGGTKVLSGLSAGTHTFRVRAVDNENPPLTGAFAVFTWTVDPDLDGPVSDGAPAVQLTATPANPSPSTVTFSYASPATDVVAYECFVDGTAAGDQVPCAGDSPAGGTKVLSGLSAGTHTFRVRAVDNENPPLTGAFAVFTWTVDPDLDGPVSDGAPAVQLTATPANPSPSTVTFSYASPATDVVAYECFVDGTAAGDQVPCAGDSPAGGTKVLSGLSAGTHTFRVRAVDNENPPLTGAFAVFTWTVDPDLDGPVSDGAPAVQLTATPANPSPSTVTFSYASPATDVVAYECFVDGTAAGDQVPCAGDSPAGGTKVLSGLSAGTHTFRVRAVDNENPPLTGAFAVFTWTVDPDLDGPVSDGAPAVQLTATPANPSPSTVTFSYASPATDVVAYECFVDGTAAGDQVPCAGDSPAGGTKVLSGLSAGTHTFRVRAVDNENPPLTGAFAVFTWTVDPDLDGPVSDGAPAVQLTATPANPSPSTVTFSYASPATDVVAYECFVDGTAAGDQVPCAGDSPAGGTKVLSGLSAGTHTFRVRAVDNENPPLTGAFAVFTWTVDPDLDGPVSDGAPAVQLTATPANPSPSTVTFSYASPATDVVAYECFVDGTAAGDQVPCAGDSPAGGTKVLSGLSAGTHTFRVRAVDNENPPLTGAFAVFTWTVDPDLDGPVSDGAPAVQLTATPANPSPSTVTFSYASPATDVVAYECFVDGTAAGDQVPCAGDSPAGGTKVLSGLSAGTHTFRVRAVDNENPPLTGAFAVFTWTVDPDLDGPVSDGAPAVQLTATPANPSPSTVTFSYASPATDVVAYECFVDGTAAGDQVPCAGDSPAGGTKVLSGLSAGTHTFRVRAVDNENPPLTGAFAVFTWTVDPDLDGPVSDGAPAVQLTATPANPSPSTVTFSYASPATDVVAYECFVDGTAAGDQVPCAGDSPAGGTKVLSGLSAGTHTFRVRAVDNENPPLTGAFAVFTWTVDPDLDGPVSDGAPAVQLTATPANPSPSTVTFSYASPATDVVAYECFVDGTAAGDQVPCAGDSPAGGTKVLSGLSAGTHTFRVRAVDNENPPLTGAFAVFTWTVDPDLDGPVSDGAPAVQLTATPANPSPSTVTFSYASPATDVVAYECFVDGTAAGDQVPCAGDSPAGGTKVLSGLSAGTHTFRVRAVDNENPPLTGAFAVFTWTVDPDLDGPVSDGAPAVQLTATPANPSPSTVTFSYASPATDVVAYECFVDGTAAGDQVPCAGDSPAGGTKVLSGLSAGTHTFRVRAVDNENPPLTGAFAVFTWTVDPDLDGPVAVLDRTPPDPSPTAVEFAYSSPSANVVDFECLIDGTEVDCEGDSPEGATLELTDLEPGPHSFKVRAVAGDDPPKSGEYAEYDWLVDPATANGAPVAILDEVPFDPSPAVASFSYSSAAPDVAAFECELDGTAIECPGTNPAGGSILLTDLERGGHTFKVRAVDNESPANIGPYATFRWVVDPSTSNGAPFTEITRRPTDRSPSTVLFGYRSLAVDVIDYDCYLDDVDVPCPGEGPDGGSTILDGLAPGGHTFRVQAIDNEDPAQKGPFATYSWRVGRGTGIEVGGLSSPDLKFGASQWRRKRLTIVVRARSDVGGPIAAVLRAGCAASPSRSSYAREPSLPPGKGRSRCACAVRPPG